MSRRMPAWLRDVVGAFAVVLWVLTLLTLLAPAGSGGQVDWPAVLLVLAMATSFGYVAALLRRDER